MTDAESAISASGDSKAESSLPPSQDGTRPKRSKINQPSLPAPTNAARPKVTVSHARDRPTEDDESVTSYESFAHLQEAHTEDVTITTFPLSKGEKKAILRKKGASAEDEPLVDTTAALTLNSKRTARLQKRQEKKQSRKVHSHIQSFLDFPPEILSLILGFLRPSDVFSQLRLNHFMRNFILENERSLAESITRRCYWVLRQCFPLPVLLEKVPASARPVLLSPQWQDRIKIHRNPYQHIKQIDPAVVCTCMSCLLSWNNLNIILDLAHWQRNFENREPLPIIPRGKNPEWNTKLLADHADIVIKAIHSPLAHSRILQTHLDVTTRTIVRSARWRKKGEKVTTPKPRLYHLTDEEAEAGTDEYLERSGPPSYQPIYMRDNYYNIEAFVPNRKWDKETQTWHYYSKWPKPHENDLAWLVARFSSYQAQAQAQAQAPPQVQVQAEAEAQTQSVIQRLPNWGSSS
ncbi:hypothetical protein PV08_04469 [Exophiala spinifera]|uniref:F-box domain-containing protein n=1 Tax=Exophiala spinifera TaxID=91928 RepID=A0A0D2BE65_9EURO|nr:uncharacterized protein PV08_04469 [Exophiala spinifera]KIW17278.1 hypothetical protein PV08_04469 [Exophiala spinifera]